MITDSHFDTKANPAGETAHHVDTNINYPIFYRTGHAQISSPLFLCAKK